MLTARFDGTCCAPSVRSVPVLNAARRSAQDFDALIESMFSGFVPRTSARAFPAINVFEDANSFHVEAELPGFSIEDLDISLTDNQLTISGERKFDVPAGSDLLRRERPTGKFSRVLRVSVDLDTQKVTATLRDGILTVTLPKAEAAKPRKINVTPA